jgi:hypothetical protein
MATNPERVRDLLGEQIPLGGHASDTMFTDEKIADLLLQAGDNVEAAVAEGWRIKAANYADLVDTAEGTSKRSMSDLHEHALRMAATYSSESGGVRARSGSRPIVRR